MRCLVCGHDAFAETKYETAVVATRALECLHCRALTLKVGEGKPQIRRKLVRRVETQGPEAIARQPSARPMAVWFADMEALVSEAELALVQAHFVLDALAGSIEGDAVDFVSDVRHCVRRAEELMGRLRRQSS